MKFKFFALMFLNILFIQCAIDTGNNADQYKTKSNISKPNFTQTPDPMQTKAKWLFDGNSNDTSGNNNNGSVVGTASYVTSPFGRAFVFNGSNYISISNYTAFNNMQSFSIEAWIYPTKYTGIDPIISKVTPNRDFVLLLDINGRPEVQFAINGSTYFHCYGSSVIPLNQWSHIVAVWTGSKWQLYDNGSLVGERDCSGYTPAWTGKNMGIGTMAGYNFVGRMDEVKIYSSALTADMIYNNWITGHYIIYPNIPNPAINGYISDNISIAYGASIKLRDQNLASNNYFVSVQLSDSSWIGQGAEANAWCTAADNTAIRNGNFDVKNFAADHGLTLYPDNYYRVKLAISEGWNEVTRLVYIQREKPIKNVIITGWNYDDDIMSPTAIVAYQNILQTPAGYRWVKSEYAEISICISENSVYYPYNPVCALKFKGYDGNGLPILQYILFSGSNR
jgi:hypothetical protein